MDEPQGSPISASLSSIYTFALSRQANRWSELSLHGAPPTGWYAQSYLTLRYLAWSKRVGLTIEGDNTEAIFYSLTRAWPNTHRLRPSTITVPAGEGTQLTVNCSDNIRYLGLFIDQKHA